MRKEMRKIPIWKVAAVILAGILTAWLVSACSSSSDDSPQTTATLVAVQETTTSVAASAAPPASSTTQSQTTTSTVLTTTMPSTTSTATTLPEVTTTVPATTAPAQPQPSAEVRVQVFNGSGLAGVAGRLTANLVDEDYIGLSPGNAPERYSSTVVFYVSPEYLGNARQIAEMLGLPDDAVQLLPDPSPFASSEAHVIVVIGSDHAADSLQDELAQLAAEAASDETTTTTTSEPRDLFPTATTMVSSSIAEPDVSVAPGDTSDGIAPPRVPDIDFGEEEATETPNIRVIVRDGPDEGGQLRYLVTRGSELKIEVLSSIGAGTARVAGYNQSGEASLFAGAWISFTASRSGVYDATFTPDSTGVAELIFQIQVS